MDSLIATNRLFLNPTSGMAAVEYLVTTWVSSDGKLYVDADLAISDCHRCVTLDFGNHISAAEVEEKLGRLERMVAEFAAAVRNALSAQTA